MRPSGGANSVLVGRRSQAPPKVGLGPECCVLPGAELRGAQKSPEEAWDWIEERPRLGRGGFGEPEKTSKTTKVGRPKEWSLPVRRGRRRQRTGRITPWRIPRRAEARVDTTDSEGNRSVGAWTRRGKEGTAPQTPENRPGLGRESPHPLLEAIDRMEVEQEARIPRSPDG
ncbi:hypothetical protein NDU88_003055 [Pleurodeles waltl]|uniref:Uncharacterized protein n=1 Tax=Pleurodeles waltl TaxID=8319 RepID=A0AAV7M5U1_PLEWA|nr:hypothetical protein NDU88_003055 [Pleurodeles waltl]